MNSSALGWTALAVVLIAVAGMIYTFRLASRQRKETSESVSTARAKHFIVRNPIFWIYILFPIVIGLGVYFIYTVAW